jgi:quinoprotein dehydrogenase-associated probable ABC transporter substrate-binding protein
VRAALALACFALAPGAFAGGLGGLGTLSDWVPYASGGGAIGDGVGDDPASRVLRVCADPDNLPYSKRDGSGFENRIAVLVAGALKARLEYVWTPPSRGFVRKTLGANLCDLLVGVPSGFAPVLTTRPYYRSSYVFVSRANEAGTPLRSFDDPRLARLRIGVQLVGNEAMAASPGQALAHAGAIDNVVGYPLYGQGPPAERMTEAVADGALDAALLWGPQAGYFAERTAVPLRIERATPPESMDRAAFEFSIAMGVKRGHETLRAALDRVLDGYHTEIDAILAGYRVPRVDRPRAEIVGRR